MRLPKTLRIPSPDTDHREGRAVPSRRGDGRAFTQKRTIKAEMPNDTASMPRVLLGWSTPTIAAPATNPRIWLAWYVILPTAEPSTNLSPGSMSGNRAVRADENGALV